jgi:glycerol-3-phosphate dehydrogenase subunit C
MATPPEKRRAHIPEGFVPSKIAKYLYIMGCWSGIRMPETAKATIELLQKAGLDFMILGEKERCCGLFLIDTRMLEEAKRIAEANTLLFESTAAEVLVTECPSCHDVYKSVYPRLYREPKYRVIHIAELLKELLDEGKLKVSAAQKEKKIIFKDPCPLVRRHGIIEPPRGIINRLGTLLEYNENAREAVCCGAPAGVKPVYPEIANKLAEMLVAEAKEKGAEEISVGCVFCMYHMAGVMKNPSQLEIKTLSQEVLESLK